MTRYQKKCEKCSTKEKSSVRYHATYWETRFIYHHNYYMKRLYIREYVDKEKWKAIGWICPRCKQIILDEPDLDNSIQELWVREQLPKGENYSF